MGWTWSLRVLEHANTVIKTEGAQWLAAHINSLAKLSAIVVHVILAHESICNMQMPTRIASKHDDAELPLRCPDLLQSTPRQEKPTPHRIAVATSHRDGRSTSSSGQGIRLAQSQPRSGDGSPTSQQCRSAIIR
jgi:hypothetical protein